MVAAGLASIAKSSGTSRVGDISASLNVSMDPHAI
jgi:hypothetical protein